MRGQLLLGRPSSGSEALVPVEELRIDTIPPGGRTTISFGLETSVRFREKGIHVFQVKLIEGDDLSTDDVRSLAVHVRDGLHTILVDGQQRPRAPLRRAAGYLSRCSLPAGREAGSRHAGPPANDDSTTSSSIRPSAISPESTASTSAICRRRTRTWRPNSMQCSKRGGGVVIGLGPGAATNRADYNRVLYADGNGRVARSAGGRWSAPRSRTIRGSDSRPRKRRIASAAPILPGETVAAGLSWPRSSRTSDWKLRRTVAPDACCRSFRRRRRPRPRAANRMRPSSSGTATAAAYRLHQHVQRGLERLAAPPVLSCRSSTNCFGSPPPIRIGTPSGSATRSRSSSRRHVGRSEGIAQRTGSDHRIAYACPPG